MRSAKTRPTIRNLFDHHRADSITLNRYIESLSMPFFFFLNRCTKQQSLEIQSISALWRMNVTLQFTRKGKNMAKLNFRSLTLSESSSEMISIEKYLCDAHRKKNLSRSLYLRVAGNFIRHGIFNTLNSCAQLVLRSVHFFSSLFSLYQMAIVFVFVYKHEKRCCWCLSARVLVFPLLVQSFVFEMRSQTVVCGGSLWLQAIYMNLSLLQLPECV